MSEFPNTNKNSRPIPKDLKRWNWGAFFLNWIWGIGNNTYIALLAFVPFVNLFIVFYLGFKGNELAWQNKKWKSVQEFKKTQKIWAIVGTIVFLFGILMTIVYMVIFFFGFFLLIPHSVPIATAMETINSDKDAINLLGQPIQAKFGFEELFQGTMQDYVVNVTFPIAGTLNTGIATLYATKEDNEWNIKLLKIKPDNGETFIINHTEDRAVYIKTNLSIENKTNAIHFSYRFTSEDSKANGRMRVFFDQTLIYEITEKEIGKEVVNKLIQLGQEYVSGIHELEIRIDPLTKAKSSAKFYSITPGFVPASTESSEQLSLEYFNTNLNYDPPTDGPAWITYVVDIPQPLFAIGAWSEFISNEGAEGYLTAYVDNRPLEKGIDERTAIQGLNNYELTNSRGKENILHSQKIIGIHQLSFRLDTYSDIPSAIAISDINLWTIDEDLFGKHTDLSGQEIIDLVDSSKMQIIRLNFSDPSYVKGNTGTVNISDKVLILAAKKE